MNANFILIFFLISFHSMAWVPNGIEIEDTKFPSVYAIYIQKSAKYLFDLDDYFANCTGTAISSRLLLTAAHCVSDVLDRKKAYPIWLGGPSEHYIFQMTPVEKVHVHPKFILGDPEHDIAILEMKEDIFEHYSEISWEEALDDEEVEIVGYGNNGSKNSGNTKRYGKNNIYYAGPDLIFIWGYKKNVWNQNYRGKDVCVGQGDSGGPLFRDEKLVGVSVAEIKINWERFIKMKLYQHAEHIKKIIMGKKICLFIPLANEEISSFVLKHLN